MATRKATRKRKCPGCESRTKMIDVLICALAQARGVTPRLILDELEAQIDAEIAQRGRRARA